MLNSFQMSDSKLDMFYIKLGENISTLRNQKRIKQETVASHLGLSRISISNIESGKQRIQLHSLMSLVDLFQVSLSDLIPNPETNTSNITNKLEKKITATEISNSKESIEKAKDFILFSQSTIKSK